MLLLLKVGVSGVDSILAVSLEELPAREVPLNGALRRRQAARCMTPLELLMVLCFTEPVEMLFVALVRDECLQAGPRELLDSVSIFMLSLD